MKNGDEQPDDRKDFSQCSKGEKAEVADDKAAGCHKENDGEEGEYIIAAHVHNITVDGKVSQCMS